MSVLPPRGCVAATIIHPGRQMEVIFAICLCCLVYSGTGDGIIAGSSKTLIRNVLQVQVLCCCFLLHKWPFVIWNSFHLIVTFFWIKLVYLYDITILVLRLVVASTALFHLQTEPVIKKKKKKIVTTFFLHQF